MTALEMVEEAINDSVKDRPIDLVHIIQDHYFGYIFIRIDYRNENNEERHRNILCFKLFEDGVTKVREQLKEVIVYFKVAGIEVGKPNEDFIKHVGEIL